MTSILDQPTLNFFYGRLRCQYSLILKGSLRQKRDFLSTFSKSAQKRRFDLLFLIRLRLKNFGQNRVFIKFWERSENQFDRPKKKVEKVFEIFFEKTPFLEKILDPPLSIHRYSVFKFFLFVFSLCVFWLISISFVFN